MTQNKFSPGDGIRYLLRTDSRTWKPEYKFHPKRRFRFDYACVSEKVGIEIDGMIWHKGGHTSGTGRKRDMEKDAEAQLMGYRVFRFAPDEVARCADVLKRI